MTRRLTGNRLAVVAFLVILGTVGAALTAACAATSVHPIHQEPDRSSDLSYSTFVSNGVVRASGARMVDGPTVTDAYVLSVPAAKATDALARLRAEPSVRLAQPLAAGDRP